jgi:threonine dehydratase
MISLADVKAAYKAISKVAIRTPLLPLKFFERPETYLKCENLQRAGAFKFRGAYNLISTLRPKVRAKGVVAYSSGNHAQGVALAAKMMGVPACIVMLNQSVAHKIAGTKAFGAEVILGGDSSEKIKKRAEDEAAARGATLVPPFNHPKIMAGQGTVGLEILEQCPGVKSVVVQIGGGGLSSGIATAIKQSKKGIKVFGVEPEGAPKMYESVKKGELVTLPGTNTVADGLKPVRAGELTFEAVRKYVDGLFLVSDEEIMTAARHLVLQEKLVVEPSGAAALAAVMSGKVKLPKGPAVVVLSGGNADLKLVLGL